MTKKVKTAVVGCGMISNIYIRNLKNLFYIIDLAAVCDINHEAAQRQAKAHDIERIMTLDEVAAAPDIELVINLTAPVAHYDVIKKMLLAGKHVYTEKMFTTKLEEAKELVGIANEKGLYLGVAPDTVLGAGIQTAKKIIESGLIGKVTSIQARVSRNQSLNSEIFKFLQNDGGALPYDVGIYYIGAMLALLGSVKSIRAVGIPAPVHKAEYLYASAPEDSWQIPGNNILSASLEFESGAVGSVLFDGNSINPEQHSFIVNGTKGTLDLGDPNEFGGSVKLILPSGECVVPFTHGYDGRNVIGDAQWYDAYGNRGIGVAEMAWAMRSGRKNYRCSKEYGLHCMEILIGMDAAAQSGTCYEPESRFVMEPLAAGYYSATNVGRGDAERSLME